MLFYYEYLHKILKIYIYHCVGRTRGRSEAAWYRVSADIYIHTRARAPVFLLASFTPCAAARRSVCPRRIRDAVPKYSPSIHAQTYLTILYHDRGLRLRLNLEVVINYYNLFFFYSFINVYTHISSTPLYTLCVRGHVIYPKFFR